MSEPSGAILRDPGSGHGEAVEWAPEESEDGSTAARRAFGWIGALGLGLEVLAAVMVGTGVWAALYMQRPLQTMALLAGAGGALAAGRALRALQRSTVREMAELLQPPSPEGALQMEENHHTQEPGRQA